MTDEEAERIARMVHDCKDIKRDVTGDWNARLWDRNQHRYVFGYGNTLWRAVKAAHEACN